ncbi:hypothetical protein LZ31DRAFT_243270 [Colletotrichum somersetense]|nr:hypothetical protein LZ31DRAFT_243270 [Colletotrichum somersetense]
MSLKHICAVCYRTRSASYHRRHPIQPGSEPLSTICRRCRSTEKEHVLVIHHYHHHHRCPKQPTDGQGCEYESENPPPAAFELPGCFAAPFRASSQALADGPPPAVNMRTKPRMPFSTFR